MRLRWPEPELGFEPDGDGPWLRAWQPRDAEVLVAAWNDPEIQRWNQVPERRDLAAAQRWIVGCQARLDRSLALDLVIVSEDRVVGEIGMSAFDMGRRAALVGYWLLAEHRGLGIATRGLQTVAAWALAAEPAGPAMQMLVARCHRANPASGLVAAGAGFDHEIDDGDNYQLWVSRAAPVRC